MRAMLGEPRGSRSKCPHVMGTSTFLRAVRCWITKSPVAVYWADAMLGGDGKQIIKIKRLNDSTKKHGPKQISHTKE